MKEGKKKYCFSCEDVGELHHYIRMDFLFNLLPWDKYTFLKSLSSR